MIVHSLILGDFEISKEDREVLQAVYDHSRKKSEPIGARTLRKKFGRTCVDKMVSRLGPEIIRLYGDRRHEHYSLSLVGISLCKRGEKDVDLIHRYLSFLIARFDEDPEIREINSQEVENRLSLPQKESQRLRHLLEVEGLWGDSASWGEKGWSVGVPHDIEQLYEIGDPGKYLAHRHSERIAQRQRETELVARYERTVSYDQGEVQGKAQTGGFPSLHVSHLSFVRNNLLREQIVSDYEEARRAYSVQAWKSCVVLCGGIIEAMMLEALDANAAEASRVYAALKPGRQREVVEWRLADMLGVAEELRLVSKGTYGVCQGIREFRNLIHPGAQMASGRRLGEHEAHVAVYVVHLVATDVNEALTGNKP